MQLEPMRQHLTNLMYMILSNSVAALCTSSLKIKLSETEMGLCTAQMYTACTLTIAVFYVHWIIYYHNLIQQSYSYSKCPALPVEKKNLKKI